VLRVRHRDKRMYVAVDDGTTDHLSAWVVRTNGAHTVHVAQGSDVRVTLARHCGLVRAVEDITRPSASVDA